MGQLAFGAYPLEHDISRITGVIPPKSWMVFMEARIWRCMPSIPHGHLPQNEVLDFLQCFRSVWRPQKCYRYYISKRIYFRLTISGYMFGLTDFRYEDYFNCQKRRHGQINIYVHKMFVVNITLSKFHVAGKHHIKLFQNGCIKSEMNFKISSDNCSYEYCGKRFPWTLFTCSNVAMAEISGKIAGWPSSLDIVVLFGVVGPNIYANRGFHFDGLTAWGHFQVLTYNIRIDMHYRIYIEFASEVDQPENILVYNGPWPGTPKVTAKQFSHQPKYYISSTFQLLLLVLQRKISDIGVIYKPHDSHESLTLSPPQQLYLSNNTGCGNSVKSWVCTFRIITPMGTYARLRVEDLTITGPYASTLESAGVGIYNIVNSTAILVAHLPNHVIPNVTFAGTENQLLVSVYAYSPFAHLSGTFVAEINQCIGRYIDTYMRPCVYMLPHFNDACNRGFYTSINVTSSCLVFHFVVPPNYLLRHRMFPIVIQLQYDGKLILDYKILYHCYEVRVYGNFEMISGHVSHSSFRALGDFDNLSIKSLNNACVYAPTTSLTLSRTSCVHPCQNVNIAVFDQRAICDICKYHWLDSSRRHNTYQIVPNETVTLRHVFGDHHVVVWLASEVRVNSGGHLITHRLVEFTQLFSQPRFIEVELREGSVWRAHKDSLTWIPFYSGDSSLQDMGLIPVTFDSPKVVRRGLYEYVILKGPPKYLVDMEKHQRNFVREIITPDDWAYTRWCEQYGGSLLTIYDSQELHFVIQRIMRPLKIEHIYIELNNPVSSPI